MKNIILQHYNGPLSEVAQLSVENIKRYAEFCGAEYQLVPGEPFEPVRGIEGGGRFSASHKVHMLDEAWDDYDVVVMLDPDMFTVSGMTNNIFETEKGVGICPPHIQSHAFARIVRAFPGIASAQHAFWGGAIYRLEREMRQKLRSYIRPHEVKAIAQTVFVDEGIMHRLAVLADIPFQPKYLLPQKWCYCSYLPDPIANAEIIHMRNKLPGGQRGNKLDNLRNLIQQGIIDG